MSKELGEHKIWIIPEWMKEFRDHIESGCGGQTAEQLMNNHTATFFNNPILCELIGMCSAKVSLLERLHKEGFIPKLERKK